MPTGRLLASAFVPYDTQYPQAGWHEQRPEAWWDSVVRSTRQLLAEASTVSPHSIRCLAISGHSLGCVPLDAEGRLLRAATPIWSDKRPAAQAARFFQRIDPRRWYRLTGNGFPAPHYTVFKILWYRDYEPEMFRRIHKVIGTKDYINYRLTGRIATDYSYASGSGVYDLLGWDYADELLAGGRLAAGLAAGDRSVDGDSRHGARPRRRRPWVCRPAFRWRAAAWTTRAWRWGRRNIAEGRMYASLGSSMWIAVSSSQPLLDDAAKPYVFTHVIPGMFTSAVGMFSAGTSLRWVRDQLCANLVEQARREGRDPYDLMTALAAQSPPGARRLLFNPSLAGGSSLEPSPHIRGALAGPGLGPHAGRRGPGGAGGDRPEPAGHARRRSGNWAKSAGRWCRRRRQPQLAVAADLRRRAGDRDRQDQRGPGGRGSLGAAAVAAVACGLWDGFERIDQVHQVESVARPDPAAAAVYRQLLPLFQQAREDQARLGDRLAAWAEGRGS